MALTDEKVDDHGAGKTAAGEHITVAVLCWCAESVCISHVVRTSEFLTSIAEVIYGVTDGFVS